VIAGVIVWLKPAPTAVVPAAINSEATRPSIQGATGQNDYLKVAKILETRCYQCHAAQVQMKNVRVDSPALVKQHAQSIYQQVVVTKIMPMANSTGITDDERAQIKTWFEAGAKTE
jgi:uncharacterized membrane protein